MTFTYLFTAKTPGAPMPVGSNLEGYTFTATGTREVGIAPINFDATGVYIYEINCVTEDSHGYIIDRQTHTVEVYVTNDVMSIAVIYISNGIKESEISFTHIYGVPSQGAFPGDSGNMAEQEALLASDDSSYSRPFTPSIPESKPGNTTDTIKDPQSTTPTPVTDFSQSGGSPKTGDYSNQALWIALIVFGSILLMLVVYTSRKSNDNNS